MYHRKIQVTKLLEAGHQLALDGVSLNFKASKEKMPKVCLALSKKDRGHDKFLRFMVVYVQVTATRSFYQQLDTYKISVEKNSESTMHTLLDRPLIQSDFICDIPDDYLAYLNHVITVEKDLVKAKYLLPEGFLQQRLYLMNYAVIKNMIIQREHHKLGEWKVFLSELYKQVDHQDYLPKVLDENKVKLTLVKNQD
jgi:hypothetical protein